MRKPELLRKKPKERGDTQMKSILTSLTAIAVYSRMCEFGYPVKGILVGVIVGALAGIAYETLKKAPPDEHREYGRRLPNGIKIYHGNIIPQNPLLVKEGVINTDNKTRSLLYGRDAELPRYLSEQPKMVYVCSNCDRGIYEGERYIAEDIVLCEDCAKSLSAEDAFAMMDIGYSIAERAEREYD